MILTNRVILTSRAILTNRAIPQILMMYLKLVMKPIWPCGSPSAVFPYLA